MTKIKMLTGFGKMETNGSLNKKGLRGMLGMQVWVEGAKECI